MIKPGHSWLRCRYSLEPDTCRMDACVDMCCISSHVVSLCVQVSCGDGSFGKQERGLVQSIVSGGTPLAAKLVQDISARWHDLERYVRNFIVVPSAAASPCWQVWMFHAVLSTHLLCEMKCLSSW
jgi:hypothetical protein